MAKRDPRVLKSEAATALDRGKFKKALKLYLALEEAEPSDGQWPRRSGDMYRRLGKKNQAIMAFERAADKYLRAGFLVKAIATCKMVLQLEPNHSQIQDTLARLNAERGITGRDAPDATRPAPSRVDTGRERTPPPGLNVGAAAQPQPIVGTPPEPARMGTPPPQPAPERMGTPPPRSAHLETPASVESPLAGPTRSSTPSPEPDRPDTSLAAAPPRVTSNKYIPVHASQLAAAKRAAGVADTMPDARVPFDDDADSGAYDSIELGVEAPDLAAPPGHVSVATTLVGRPGQMLLPATPAGKEAKRENNRRGRRRTIPPDAPLEAVSLGQVVPGARPELDERGEDSGIIEIPIDELDLLDSGPNQGPDAEQVLRRTPLLSALGPDAMQRLVREVSLMQLAAGEILYRAGEPGRTLYVIVEGSVAVFSGGPGSTRLADLGEGEFLGESALVSDHVRNVTAVADPERGAQVLALDRNVIGNLIEEEPQLLQELLRFLRDRLVNSLVHTSPLFAPFAGDERHQLAARFRFLEVNAGTVVVAQGSRSTGLFVLLSGKLEAVHQDGDHERRLGALEPGGVCGEMSLLANEPALFTVRTTTKSFVLQLPAEDFREIIMTHPQVLVYVSDLAEERRRRYQAILSGDAVYDAGRVTLV